MRLIRIALKLKNKEYAQDLAMRLSEMSGGLDIEIFPQNAYINTEKYDIILGDKDVDICSPVTNLLNHIVDEYQEKSGEFFVSGKSNLNIYTLRSVTGGAGTTAIAIALARSLALLSNTNNVLFISTIRNLTCNYYLDLKTENLRSPAELDYLLSHGKSVNINSFVQKDDDSVNYLRIQSKVEVLLRVLPEISDYTHVVIDLGTNPPLNIDGEYNQILIINEKDLRSELVKENDHETVLYNNSSLGESNHIPFTPESFLRDEHGIKILKEGLFYRTVKNYAKNIERNNLAL